MGSSAGRMRTHSAAQRGSLAPVELDHASCEHSAVVHVFAAMALAPVNDGEHDERIAQGPTSPPRARRVPVHPPVVDAAGRREHREHQASVRASGTRDRTRLARRPDRRHRLRPGRVGRLGGLAGRLSTSGHATSGMGRAGIVMGLEVSRLARNNADWHRLLEICALADTLILDEDGVYDPTSFNDRLLLGLKGTMSEAELHVLKARLRGGILNKVRRGEYRCRASDRFRVRRGRQRRPRSRLAGPGDDRVLLRDVLPGRLRAPDGQGVPERGPLLSISPSQPRRREGDLPTADRVDGDAHAAQPTIRRRLRVRTATAIAEPPMGRRSSESAIAATGSPASRTLIPATSPGSDTRRISESSRANGRGYEVARSSPPREGAALLQGRAVCGRCGRHFRVRYAARRGRLESWYVCDRANGEPRRAELPVDRRAPDRRGGRALVAERMTPAAVELALEIRQGDRSSARGGRSAALSRDRARPDRSGSGAAPIHDGRSEQSPRRRYARGRLERQAACAGQGTRGTGARPTSRIGLVLDDAIRERLVAMTTDFKKLWADPATPNRERKRLLAYIIEDVTLIKFQAEGSTKIHVRFKGGKTETLTTLNPKSSAQQVKTPTEIVELVDQLLDDHIYSEIADLLNERGLRPGGSARPGREHARLHREASRLSRPRLRPPLRYDRLRDRGMLTKKEMARRLGIHEAHARPVGEARDHHQTCLQRPRVPVRGSRAEPADQALQPMGSAGRPSGAHRRRAHDSQDAYIEPEEV